MGRGKTKLELISNASARRTTFRKRKAGLMKKVGELSALCGVMVCAVIYSNFETQPIISPSPLEVRRVLKKLQKLPRKKVRKYMLNQDTFLSENESKLKRKLQKEREKNRNLEIQQLVSEYSLDKESIKTTHSDKDLEGICSFLDDKIKKVTKRINFLKGSDVI